MHNNTSGPNEQKVEILKQENQRLKAKAEKRKRKNKLLEEDCGNLQKERDEYFFMFGIRHDTSNKSTQTNEVSVSNVNSKKRRIK